MLGYVDRQAPQKPRMPMAGFRHEEHYRQDVLPETIRSYNQTIVEHWQQTGRTDGDNWGNNTASYYQHRYLPAVQHAIL